ncbi:MAG: methyltransferase domain-containing protein [Bacteroidales bacterium]|jgi:SAM-dependent methyltransferase
MEQKFLDILCCPITKQSLYLETTKLFDNGTVEEGFLTTKNKEYKYPILKGIPRFVSKENYAKSFGFEWKKWALVQYESENIGKPMENWTTKMFEKITSLPDEYFKNKLIIDFGCGGGRFIDVVRKKGGTVVGIDMSLAVEPAKEYFINDKNVLIIQGDILNPPFKENAFDMGYAIGVLHHTPNPFSAFKELHKTLKKGAYLACCVYTKKGYYDFKSVRRFRKLIQITRFLFGYNLAILYAKFSATFLFKYFPYFSKVPKYGGDKIKYYLEQNWFPVLYLPDKRWRILDVFDSITPKYASAHTEEEVFSWYTNTNCSDIKNTDFFKSSFSGIK